MDGLTGVILLALVAGGGIIVIDAFVIRKIRQLRPTPQREAETESTSQPPPAS